MKKQTKIIIGVIIVVVVVLPLVYWGLTSGKPGKYDTFAQCLEEKGATFYGAFWCPNCVDQKREFGRSASLLPYVECSTANRQNQTQVCIDAGITAYPTWEFSEGERVTGTVSLEVLAEKTGCELPV